MSKVNASLAISSLVSLMRAAIDKEIKHINQVETITGAFKVFDTKTTKQILLDTQARYTITVNATPFQCVVKTASIGAGCWKVWFEWHETL